MLRTLRSSFITTEPRSFASQPALLPVAAMCSAASMPERMAWWVPLIFGTLTRPAESPISIAPGISTLGSDW